MVAAERAWDHSILVFANVDKKSIDKLSDKITEETINQHLYTVGLPDPDLIIRTSGTERLSGFLMWQSAYSEFYFAECYWPMFREIDLYRAIRTFQQRQRNFGK